MSRPPVLGGLLAVLACLLLPLAVLATWVDTVVSDTDAYVDTVGPLAEDPDVQSAAADRLVAVADANLPLGGTRPVLRQAALQVVQSQVFPPVWRDANRAAHEQAIRVLEDEQDGDVTVELDGLFQALVSDLDPGQVLPTGQLPDVDPRFTIAESEDLEQARSAYAFLDTAGFWLPLASVFLAALALVVARRRRRTAIVLGFGSALGMLLVLAGLPVARTVAMDQVPPADQELARAVWEVVTESLRTGATVVLAIGLLVALVMLLLGLVTGRRRAPA